MLFIHTLDKVLSGQKTQTRRIVKSGDAELVKPIRTDRVSFQRNLMYVAYPADDVREITGVERNGRRFWNVGCDYAAQPARGKAAVARIRITAIERNKNVRMLTSQEAMYEGFDSSAEFWAVWCQMHDKEAYKYICNMVSWQLSHAHFIQGMMDSPKVFEWLDARPRHRYDAWVLTFELVTGGRTT